MIEVYEGFHCDGCYYKAGEKKTMEYCMKYGCECPESNQDIIKSIELCIQDTRLKEITYELSRIKEIIYFGEGEVKKWGENYG